MGDLGGRSEFIPDPLWASQFVEDDLGSVDDILEYRVPGELDAHPRLLRALAGEDKLNARRHMGACDRAAILALEKLDELSTTGCYVGRLPVQPAPLRPQSVRQIALITWFR